MVTSLAPAHYPAMPVIEGVSLATAEAAIKAPGRTDALLMCFAPGTQVAGVFTRSLTPAAPVDHCRRALPQGQLRALLVNSGNANAFTGKAGDAAVHACTEALAAQLSCRTEEIMVASTGVIGQPLPHERLIAALPALHGGQAPDRWEAAARAIMTTDAFPKYATRDCLLEGRRVTLNGIAKGAGMIAPDMATMLCFIATDAALPAVLLQPLLEEATHLSFNAVSVDGDTSTNDTVLLAATQASGAGARLCDVHDPALAAFRQALLSLMQELAQMLVRDGEGASKFITITVEEAQSPAAARRIALAIANSPLVKTAFAGSDPNWGRIVMAVGKSGERAERDRLWIRFGDIPVAADGAVHPAYREAMGADYFTQDSLTITVGVGAGNGSFTLWTCDLGHEYVRINADYRS